jgi:hypothetical protein
LVASVGPGPQEGDGLVQVAVLAQQFDQLPCGILVAGVGPGPQEAGGLVQVTEFAQQTGQLPRGV